MADPRRVVVLAPNWLGDAVMALAGACGPCAAYAPEAHLAVAARPSVAALYAMVPEVDAVVPLAPRAPITRVSAWQGDAARLAAERFDLAVLLPNSFMSAWTAARAAIPERWGYAAQGRGRLLTRRVRRPARAAAPGRLLPRARRRARAAARRRGSRRSR